MTENQLRDLLVENLTILNPNYTLLNKEAYLPNNVGTRSFIDILALNDNGKYVIIELKKSNVSARQAIHELYKYLEAVKQNLAVKSDEVELVIVSTEWKELLVPYSAFVSSVDLKSYGYHLFVENGVLSSKKIDTNAIEEDRVLSAVQMARYYLTEGSLKEGIQEHVNFFRNRGINNFILLVLKSPENYADLVLQSLQKFENNYFNEIRSKTLDPSLNYDYMIYSINQTLSLSKSLKILTEFYSNSDILSHIDEITHSSNTIYSKMEMLNELILEQEPFPKADYAEIGTPAKYVRFIEDEGWNLVKIEKYGALLENILLTDELIEQELIASGTTKERYISEIDIMNSASISRVRKEIKNCLSDNIVWRNHILEIIEQLTEEKEKVKHIRISIYNPMNIIYSIYLLFNEPIGLRYIPSYQIEVVLNDEERMYIGYLDGDLNNLSMEDILSKFWNSHTIEFLLTLNWGGYFRENLELCDFIGLEYKTMLVKVNSGNHKYFKYRNYNFLEIEHFDCLSNIVEILSHDAYLVPDILTFFQKHNGQNGYWEYNDE